MNDDFLDEILDEGKKVAKNATSSVGEWFGNTLDNVLGLKKGVSPKGNLSQLDLDQGQRGAGTPLRPSTQAGELLARAGEYVYDPKNLLGVAVLGLGIWYFLKRR